ncbi:RAMP superfamily CRISPR-associated protein [Thermoleptolyngbya sichuanensis XZ-Cy5]|uniref:RAMP superfamily CRISPR-associated protein n=1 Tax=Thermoleptolyngbya sichuanensis TaxID=2885951 RepID=UPI00240E0B7C|nr:RAMP superfamily CRISPR-associated protein [Thermoleptolyngbya sichuanensis]MDG2616070.1 RAMP superfamily CRISPR-associated protein [Thermoleptolyngbya sichuanensis XZ-Cy5]
MPTYTLNIHLLSDTTFGRGDGVAGLIDQEVEHDPYGFPYLRGRTLKGLLSEECDNLIHTLPGNQKIYWQGVAGELFGKPGSTLETIGAIHVGDACLPEDLRQAVAYQISWGKLTRTEILDSLTTIRRQTAINPETGVPDRGSLRSARVVLRGLTFTAGLSFEQQPTDDQLCLLMIAAKALRYLGSGRNRGRGHVRCHFHGESLPSNYLDRFFAIQEA